MVSDEKLISSSEVIAKKCISHRSGENVVIVSDTSQSSRINHILLDVLTKAGIDAELIVMRPRRYPGEEPPRPVAEALRSADIVVSIPTGSITYSEAVTTARKSGTRFLVATGVTEEVLSNLVRLDNFDSIGDKTRNAAGLLDGAKEIHITSQRGTDLRIKVKAARALAIDGVVRDKSDMSFLPPGTTHIAPITGAADGKAVIDGSLVPLGILREPVTFQIANGRVARVEGGEEARKYEIFLNGFSDPNVFSVAEVGFGLNPAAKLTGLAIVDERIAGSAFIGIGRNIQIGGPIQAKTHTDAIMMNVSLSMDGREIVKEGKLLL